MKQKDDSTLSLFGDELPVSDLKDADPSQKKLLDEQTAQANHVASPLDIQAKSDVVEVVATSPIDATPPKPRTNSPWAAAIAARQTPKPHIMLIITKGEHFSFVDGLKPGHFLALACAVIWAGYCTVTARMAQGKNGVTLFFILTALTLWAKFLATGGEMPGVIFVAVGPVEADRGPGQSWKAACEVVVDGAAPAVQDRCGDGFTGCQQAPAFVASPGFQGVGVIRQRAHALFNIKGSHRSLCYPAGQ